MSLAKSSCGLYVRACACVCDRLVYCIWCCVTGHEVLNGQTKMAHETKSEE